MSLYNYNLLINPILNCYNFYIFKFKMDYLGVAAPDYDALLKKMNVAKKRFSNESKLFDINKLEK